MRAHPHYLQRPGAGSARAPPAPRAAAPRSPRSPPQPLALPCTRLPRGDASQKKRGHPRRPGTAVEGGEKPAARRNAGLVEK